MMCVVALDRIFLLTLPLTYIKLPPTYGRAIFGAAVVYGLGNTLAAVVWVYTVKSVRGNRRDRVLATKRMPIQ